MAAARAVVLTLPGSASAQLDLAPAVVGHVLDVVWETAGVRPDRDVDVLAAEVVRLDEREGGEDGQHRAIRQEKKKGLA